MSLILTSGEPAGIGPDIILSLWHEQQSLFQNIRVIGDPQLLSARAELLRIPFNTNEFPLIPMPLNTPAIPGKLNSQNAEYVMNMLTLATNYCLQGKAKGIVTAPIHKGVLNDAGFRINGHTDFFTRKTHTKQTVMMLMTSEMKITLLTEHVPLRRVPDVITPDHFSSALKIIIDYFERYFLISQPVIHVCGVNPHAGENGYLGTEEQTVLMPVIKAFQAQGHRVNGPFAADIAFTKPYLHKADVTLAMYHDQGLPTLKYSGFHEAVNVTLGLPFIRTSVDHGTALDIAGTGKADINSLTQAILLANSLCQH